MIRLVVLAVLLATPAVAQRVTDPDWPCIQRRQPQLSIAQVWTGPIPDESIEEQAKTPDVRDLARVIALRRTDLAEAEAMIDSFASGHDAADLTALFLASFTDIQKARDRVMSGITRYAHAQEALDTQINEMRQSFTGLTAAEPQDFDAIDKLETDLDWATRVFKDRQQSLTYVCETPVILEQRAFALGRFIQGRLPN